MPYHLEIQALRFEVAPPWPLHIALFVIVTDPNGEPVPGLPQNSFVVYEKTGLIPPESGVTPFVKVDISNFSENPHLPGLYEIALAVVHDLPRDRIYAVRVSYHPAVKPGQFTTTNPIVGMGLLYVGQG